MNSFLGVLKWLGGKLSVLVLLIAAALIGYWIGHGVDTSSSNDASTPAEARAETETAAEEWTCSMHPQIRRPEPGQCPICGMDLIPVKKEGGPSAGKAKAGKPRTKKKPKYACAMFCVPPMDRPGKCPVCGMEMVEVKTDEAGEEADASPRRLRLSPAAEKLAEVQVAPVERKFVAAKIRMVGKIDYDETRVGYITAWIPGRLDRLYVDYTGIPVQKGDKLVYLYSPELLSAQEELFQAKKAVHDLENSGLKSVRSTARKTVLAVREKLRLWGLSADQIAEIEERATPSDHMTILAPMSGIVIHKNALDGMYVRTGTRIYTIADLSQVWVKLDAYESDLPWIRYGQEVEFETEAYPGQTFKGRIAFIDPYLMAKTRTVKIRVNVANPDGRLKPEMFVRAVVRARVAAGGKVMDPALEGKWISPKHPEVVKDEPGTCDICGVPLVRAETLGYVSAAEANRVAPLVVPASAPLITGKRAVVYVAVPGKPGTYEGREIVLGPRAGDYYIVKEGLEEGEEVVVNGNFKIDSAIQIQARPSMMSPQGGTPAPGHRHGAPPKNSPEKADEDTHLAVPAAFKAQLDPVYDAYFEIQEQLSQDSDAGARAGAEAFLDALGQVDMKHLEGETHSRWMKEQGELRTIASELAKAPDIVKARELFAALSEGMIAVGSAFGSSKKQPILRFHCPMAFDNRGADWLQNRPETANPYFGSAMFRCGKQVEVLQPGSQKPGKPQTLCPVMGNEIDREVFLDYRGKRIYFCCPPCIARFKNDPEKYLRKMTEAGVVPEDTPPEKPATTETKTEKE
jgi:Cu(I)/Ag(I) efflux system membrane fusion protein